MRNIFLLILFIISPLLIFSQNRIEITGTISDSLGIPLESVTVYINKLSDENFIDYTITDQKGFFKLNVKPSSEDYILKASLISMKDYNQVIKLDKNQNFPAIILKDDMNLLNEIVITAETPPVRIKNDTIEFNAASFKVMPDANVESLLKQLPGVVFDGSGGITINGKQVNQFLVNGKPFFGTDGKMALQNLPAELIQKVQISDTKSKLEQFTNERSSSDYSSINLTIDEKKNTGYFGKLTLGYGTDDRYETGLMANYFKNKTRISLIGSSNNINSSGFSMDEVFDNMSSGRSGSGITTSHNLGLNYNDEWFKDFETSASYNFDQNENENISKTRRVNLLSDGNFISNSQNESSSISKTHNFRSEFEYKVANKWRLFYAPSLIVSNNENQSNGSQNSEEDGALLNESNSRNLSNSNQKTFSNNFLLVRSFDKKGRRLSFDANVNNASNENESRLNSETFFYTTNTNDIRNQYENSRSVTDTYTFSSKFSEPITDSLKLEIAFDFEKNYSVEERNTFDYDALNQDFTNKNELLSNYITATNTQFLPTAGINLNKKKHDFRFNAATKIIYFNPVSTYLNIVTSLSRDYMLPHASFSYTYKPMRGKNLRFRYNYNTNLPTARQILPFEDLSNPLNTITGNSDLDVSRNHNLNVTFRYNNATTKNSYSVFSNFIHRDKSIISITDYDQNRKRFTTYQNIEGTYTALLGAGWFKSKKIDANNYSYGLNVNSNYNYNKGFVNANFFDMRQFTVGPSIFLNYEYGEIFKLSPSYSFNYGITNYENYVIKSAQNNRHQFNLQSTTYWPKNFIWGNDFGYTYNSNLDASFKRDFYLWNTSLAYYVFDKKLLAKVKIYDILNQNIGNTRSVTETAITDQENLVLKRYFMFSLTYKLDKFGGDANDKKTNNQARENQRGTQRGNRGR